MEIELTLKNFRCFSSAKPARLTIRDGFTAFLGANNAGKSSLLRFFYEFRLFFQELSNFSQPNSLEALKGVGGVPGFPHTVEDRDEVFFDRNQQPIEIELRVVEGEASVTDKSSQVVRGVRFTMDHRTSATPHRYRIELIGKKELPLRGQFTGRNNVSLNWIPPGETTSQILDVSLLTQAFLHLASTLYIGPFRNAINVGEMQNYYDLRVGRAFITQWRELKTGAQRRDNEAILNLTESIKNLFGFRSLEINPTSDNSTLKIFLDGKSYKLNDLGAGLAQFIVVLGNAAVTQPHFILIDEPELSLHPSLQLDFLTTLGSFARAGVLFATHSYGLARAAAEQIYSVRRVDGGVSEVTPLEDTPRLSEMLGELSYSGYKELGFDKVLLVEGRTEIKTIQQFLRHFRKEHEIVILPLGGSQLINAESEAELAEIKRISEHVYALIDSERTAVGTSAGPERTAFAELCKKLDIKCHMTERRATENYFTERAIKQVLGEQYTGLQPYERPKDAKHGWAKSSNWRIARAMRKEDIEANDLGAFLASL